MNPLLVTLLGARMRYAVPRILSRAGRLERFFTDFSAEHGWARCAKLVPPLLRPASLHRFCARVALGVPRSKVTAFNRLGLDYARRRRTAPPGHQLEVFLWSGREFCRLVNASSWGNARGVFTFNSAGLETLQKARREGRYAVMEQTIAPRRIEQEILSREFALHPEWQEQPKDLLLDEYCEREAAEWAASNLIVCGSPFVVEGIRLLGGPFERCVVVPYGVDMPNLLVPADVISGKRKETQPLRILTVGAVGLRKGAPYVTAAAERLKGQAEFRWVGGIEIRSAAARRMAESVQLTGPVPSTCMAEHFQWADVFVLPSLCEGSATVTYESLGWGLPVICTPNTGSVIRDHIEGFIVPPRSADSIIACIEELRRSPDLRVILSENARRRAGEFSLERYGQRLIAVLDDAKH